MAKSLYNETIEGLGYNQSGGLIETERENLSGKKAHIAGRLRNLIPEISSVYYSENVPLVYLAQGENFSKSNLIKLHQKVWNDIHAPISIVVDNDWIRIYDNWGIPTDDQNGAEDDKRLIGKFDDISKVLTGYPRLHRRYMDSGSYLDEKFSARFEIKNRCDQTLLKNLKETFNELVTAGLQKKFAHSLILRSILLLHLEHRNILGVDIYHRFDSNAGKLTEIYRDYKSSIEFFKYVSQPDYFNGDLLPISEHEEDELQPEHLSTLADFLEGEIEMNSGQMNLWKMYRFDIIPIQMISTMYEELLHQSDSKSAKSSGVYYTPYPVVELMLNEVLPYPNEAEKDENQKIRYKKVLDPTCGSGIFLVESFRRLVYYWQENNPDKNITLSEITDLLSKYIFGIDKDINAIRISCFSLYLAILDFLGDLKFEEIHFPKLVSERAGKPANLTVSHAFDEKLVEKYREQFDLVIGNPPWLGEKALDETTAKYLLNQNKPHGTETATAFTWLFSDYSCDNIAILIPGTIFFNKDDQYNDFRNKIVTALNINIMFNLYFLKNTKKEDLKFKAPPMALVASKNEMNLNDSHFLVTPVWDQSSSEDPRIMIDSNSIKSLSYRKKLNLPVLIKSCGFGDWRDLRLVHRFTKKQKLLKDVKEGQRERSLRLRRKETTNALLWSGVGYTRGGNDESQFLADLPCINPKKLSKYVVDENNYRDEKDKPAFNEFSRIRDENLYRGAKLLLKESSRFGKAVSAFSEGDCAFTKTISAFHLNSEDTNLLKAHVVYFNSSLASYLIFITSRVGIDRPRSKPVDWDEIPIGPILETENKVKLAQKLDEYKTLKTEKDKTKFEQECDELIFDIFKLSYSERILVKDLMDYKIKYYLNPGKEYKPDYVSTDDLKKYANALIYIMDKNFTSGKNFIRSEIFEPSDELPLAMVSFELTTDKTEQGKIQVRNTEQFSEFLNVLDKKLVTQESINIYRRRHFMYFDHEKVYIIKPNHKFYWLQSAGFHDADEIVTKSIQGKLNAN